MKLRRVLTSNTPRRVAAQAGDNRTSDRRTVLNSLVIARVHTDW